MKINDVIFDDNNCALISTKQLFINSMKPNLFNAHLIFRYYVAKCFLTNKNTTEAFELYNTMQQLRVSQNPKIPQDKANNEQNFKNLILSIKQNGFAANSPIIINNKLKLFNGSHRLAIALLLNIETVPIKLDPETQYIDNPYDIEWFEKNNLSKHIQIIKQTKKEIEQRYNISLD